MNLHDLDQHTTASIADRDWETDPIDEKWFELNPDWKCDEEEARYSSPANLQSKLAEWDLLSFFFPREEKPPPPTSPPISIGGEPSLEDTSHRRMTAREVEVV